MSRTVIKAGSADAMSLGFSRLDLRDIRREADALLERAAADAEGILTQAHVAAQAHQAKVRETARYAGREEGFAAGLVEGRTAGLEEARKRFAAENETMVNTLRALLDEWSGGRERLHQAARRDVLVLALAVVRRLWSGLEQVDAAACGAAAEVCGEAIALLKNPTNLIIKAHPRDWAAVREVAEALAAKFDNRPDLRVVEDAGLARGGVLVETADGEIDATINTRIDRIADALLTDWRERMKELSIT